MTTVNYKCLLCPEVGEVLVLHQRGSTQTDEPLLCAICINFILQVISSLDDRPPEAAKCDNGLVAASPGPELVSVAAPPPPCLNSLGTNYLLSASRGASSLFRLMPESRLKEQPLEGLRLRQHRLY